MGLLSHPRIGHTRQKFVAYPIGDADEPGQQLINFVAELRGDDTELSEREDWSRRGDLADVLPAFEGWDFGWLDAGDLLRRAPDTWVYLMGRPRSAAAVVLRARDPPG